jgi:hypothetical protein
MNLLSVYTRNCLIFLNTFIIVTCIYSPSGYAQKDPNAKVIREVKTDKADRIRGLKIYSNGDIEFRDGKIIKKDGTVYYPNGKVVKRNGDGSGEHKGRKILTGGIVVGQDGKLEDVCGKSNDCKKLRDAKFINENGVWKPRN